MFLNGNNEDISSFIADLKNTKFYYQRDVFALYFSKNRAAVMSGFIDRPEINTPRITRIKGQRIHLPSIKPILNISIGEAANPQLVEIELYKKQGTKILHNAYAPLKCILNSYGCEEIDFEGEFKSEVRGLEEISEHLVSENRIVISNNKVQINQVMNKPHYKYCLLILVREFQSKLY